jgi:hypothetical protein
MKLYELDKSIFPPVSELVHNLYSKYGMFRNAGISGGGGNGGTDYTFLTTRATIISTYVTGNTFYLDPINGSDAAPGDGSSEHPWATIAKSQASCPAGSLVYLRSGNYGAMDDDAYGATRTNWTVYMNELGSTPVITSLVCTGGSDYNLRLIFYGVKFAPAWVDPGASAPYNKTATPVYLYHANYFRFYNCEIVGTNKYLTVDSFYLSYTNYIFVERCRIHLTAEGPTYLYSSNLTFRYCYIYDLCASGIKDGTAGSSYITIEGNHIRNLGYSTSDQYGSDAAYHGSIIAMNNGTYTIRNNFLHWGGGTNPICFYTGGSPVYSDVLIENNVIYNATATVAIDMDNVAGVIFRNNTIIGRKRDPVETGDYRYNLSLYISGFASGYDGSGLHIYNNIFVGLCGSGVSTTLVDKDYNIVYQGSFLDTAHSIVASVDKTATYFESNFFNGTLTLRDPATDSILDLTLKAGSDGINFGLASYQPSDSLGGFDENYEFLNPTGKARSASAHDAGAYQS